MPARFASLAGALDSGRSVRGRESIDAALGDELRDVAAARLRANDDGSVEWWADREALEQTVRLHRSRNYWKEWQSLALPALFVHGGRSREVRPRVVERMLALNPRVTYLEFEGVGHNIPLLAPKALASALSQFWAGLR